MPRLPYPDLEKSSDAVRDIMAAIPFDLAIARMVAHADGAFSAWMGMGGAIVGKSSLDRDIAELAICVATSLDSPRYEYAYHRLAFQGVGGTPEQTSAIERRDYRSPVFSERQQAALVFAREVHDNVRASDAALAAVREHFTDRQVVELILCVGMYMLNSRVAENSGVSIEDDKLIAKPGQPIPEAAGF